MRHEALTSSFSHAIQFNRRRRVRPTALLITRAFCHTNAQKKIRLSVRSLHTEFVWSDQPQADDKDDAGCSDDSYPSMIEKRMGWIRKVWLRWLVWPTAMLLLLQPLAANCCSCTCLTDDCEVGEVDCEHDHSHNAPQAREQVVDLDHAENIVNFFPPCKCPPSCPVRLLPAPDLISRPANGQLLRNAQASMTPFQTSATISQRFETDDTGVPALIDLPSTSGAVRCAILCRFNT